MWITVATPSFTDPAHFDRVVAEIGTVPEGMLARYLGRTDDGLRVVVVWESQQHAERFFTDLLAPALAKALGPQPEGRPRIQHIEVLQSYLPERV